jgi:hypothetical protein
MSEALRNIESRAREIATQWGTLLDSLLGHGIDGNVWQTERLSASRFSSALIPSSANAIAIDG